jgi:carbon-monoxide dehydrogenase small subunit
MLISLEVNGERVNAQVLPRLNLADFLREHLKLTGTHVGCEHGVCGACTVRVNGEIVRSCLMLAVQTDGASVVTIEGLSDSGEIADLQAAFRDRNALQCGFCTPGMLVAAQELLKQEIEPDRERIREHLSAITAAARAIKPLSMRSRLRRGRAWDASRDGRIGKSRCSHGAGSAEFIHRQSGPAAQSRAAYAGTRAIR